LVKDFSFNRGSDGVTSKNLNGQVDFRQKAWNPIGSAILSEVMIPKGGYIVLKLPDDSLGKAFRVTPIKMKDNDNKDFLKLDDPMVSTSGFGTSYAKIAVQWPVLLEGGMNVVADASAVDGINFKLLYQLTTGDGINPDTILTMNINKNPCENLDKKYQLEIGCRNPIKIDCDKNSMPDKQDVTADCCTPDQVTAKICESIEQVCKFNNCSTTLFNIPENLKQYIGKYDPGKTKENNYIPPVKTFVEKPENLKDLTAPKLFCNKIHANIGDFTPYCYDYNDTGSSINLTGTFKMKLIVSDLG
jgi:hypothetical protein